MTQRRRSTNSAGLRREALPATARQPVARTPVGVELIAVAIVLFLSVFSVLAGADCGVLDLGTAQSRRSDRILERTLIELSERTWDEVAAMRGEVKNVVASADQGERFRIDLKVSQASLGLLQIDAVLIDGWSGMPAGRLTTYRGRPTRSELSHR